MMKRCGLVESFDKAVRQLLQQPETQIEVDGSSLALHADELFENGAAREPKAAAMEIDVESFYWIE
jgi:hypothetical protein